MLPAGRLSVSALAAPRTEGLWPDLAAEIDESLREGGATVRSFTGEWGRELHARTGDASSLFVGVDGPRWMLYGVATGPTGSARELDAALRVMLRGSVVVRGRSPYPVRTVLPLTVPEHLSRPGPIAVPDRVPVPRASAEHAPAPPPVRPAPLADAPTTITVLPQALRLMTPPHGIPRIPEPVADEERPDAPSEPRSRHRSRHRGRPGSGGVAGAGRRTRGGDSDRGDPTASRSPSSAGPNDRRDLPRGHHSGVPELVAQAERDRAAAERTAGPARTGRPGHRRRPGPGRPTAGAGGDAARSGAGRPCARSARAQTDERQRGGRLPEQRFRSPGTHARRVRDAARCGGRRRTSHRLRPVRDERVGERIVVLGERGGVRPAELVAHDVPRPTART
jgi:hypothetical protein